MASSPSLLPAIIALAAPAALADAWQPLTGDEIVSALTGHTVVYGPDEQIFFASGRTRYRLLRDRWGWWEVRNDSFCSLWPPAETWTCHTVETGADGLVRFTAEAGLVVEGTIAE